MDSNESDIFISKNVDDNNDENTSNELDDLILPRLKNALIYFNQI
jgi:hypothetical protein